MVWWSTRTTWGSTATSGLSLQSRARFVLLSLLLSLFYFLYHHHCHMMISFKIWISRDWTGYHAWEDGRGNYAWDIGALNSNMMSYSVSRCLFCITFLFPYFLFTIVLLIIIKRTQSCSQGLGRLNTNFAVWGKNVQLPMAGTVVTAVEKVTY